MPVSYTHLFHEQRSGRVAVVNAVGVVPSGPVAPVSGRPVVGVIPVSYTHLDVYKRQDLVNVERVKEYAAEDADVTLQLKHVLYPQVEKIGLQHLYFEVEEPMIAVLADML